jgi:hypothetical protein
MLRQIDAALITVELDLFTVDPLGLLQNLQRDLPAMPVSQQNQKPRGNFGRVLQETCSGEHASLSAPAGPPGEARLGAERGRP